MRPYIHACMHTCTHAHMRTYTHAYIHTCIHTHTCIHAHAHMHMHTCTHAHMHTCTHAHMHIHTCTCILAVMTSTSQRTSTSKRVPIPRSLSIDGVAQKKAGGTKGRKNWSNEHTECKRIRGMHAYACMRAYIHTYIHTYTPICVSTVLVNRAKQTKVEHRVGSLV